MGSHVVAICCLCRSSFKILRTDSNEINGHVSNFIDSFSSVLEDRFFLLYHFLMFCPSVCSGCLGFFSRGHTTFDLVKLVKTCVLPIVYSPKAAFNILKVCVAYFHSLRKTCHLSISRYAKIASVITHTFISQGIQQPHILQPYSKLEMM